MAKGIRQSPNKSVVEPPRPPAQPPVAVMAAKIIEPDNKQNETNRIWAKILGHNHTGDTHK
jgi:hypothetical protein